MLSLREFWNVFSRQMKPRFQEISAYLIALSCCWLFVSRPDFREGALLFFSGFGYMSPFFIGFGLMLAAGLVLSLAHAFIKRKKSRYERFLMGWFLTGTCAVSSFFVGTEMLSSRSSLTLVLAVWNIVMSVVILAQMGMQKYDVADEDAPIAEAFVTTAVLAVFLLLSDLYLHLSWALTLSICIFYSTSVIYIATWMIDRFGWQFAGILKTRRTKRG